MVIWWSTAYWTASPSGFPLVKNTQVLRIPEIGALVRFVTMPLPIFPSPTKPKGLLETARAPHTPNAGSTDWPRLRIQPSARVLHWQACLPRRLNMLVQECLVEHTHVIVYLKMLLIKQ